MKVSIFRVEHKDNKAGMYNNPGFPSLFDCPYYYKFRKNDTLHPRPENDTVLKNQLIAKGLYITDVPWFAENWTEESQKYIFGFGSLEQLKMWLHDHNVVEWLSEFGYVIAEFEVEADHAIIGQSQAMFIRPRKHPVLHAWNEVFNLSTSDK